MSAESESCRARAGDTDRVAALYAEGLAVYAARHWREARERFLAVSRIQHDYADVQDRLIRCVEREYTTGAWVDPRSRSSQSASQPHTNLPTGVAMAGANCHGCVTNIGTLQQPVGNRQEPFGACRNCSAFACGHHGHRDPHVPEFICVECDPKLLAASAAAIASQAAAAPVIQALRAGYHLSMAPPERWAIASLDDFQRRRPGYGIEVVNRARELRWNVAWVENLVIPRPGQELLMLAGLIARRLRLPEGDLPRPLQGIWRSVE